MSKHIILSEEGAKRLAKIMENPPRANDKLRNAMQERYCRIELPPEAMEKVWDLIENPPGPSEYLKAAAKRYKEEVKKRNKDKS